MMNEILLYGGMGIAAAALITAVIYFIFSRMKRAQLNSCFDKEYGNTTEKRNRNPR